MIYPFRSTVWLEIFADYIKFSRISLDLTFRDLIFEDRHAVLAPPTSNYKLTIPIAQQLGNL